MSASDVHALSKPSARVARAGAFCGICGPAARSAALRERHHVNSRPVRRGAPASVAARRGSRARAYMLRATREQRVLQWPAATLR